jgi:capsular polysaccharide transport system permease protein
MKSREKIVFFILLPTAIAFIYFFFVATNMYISESRFSIRSQDGGGSSDWLSLLGQAGGSTASDAYILEDYIHSYSLLVELDEELGVKSHYQNSDADYISRLKSEPKREEYLKYYQKIVNIRYDSATGIIVLTTRAYTPEMAQLLNKHIILKGEKLINDLSTRAMNDLLALTRSEVLVAEQRLSAARQEMKQFRQESDLLDPATAAGAVLGLVSQLESQVAMARTELAQLRSYMQEDSSAIVALKAKNKALDEQIEFEQSRLTGENSRGINQVVARYEELSIEHEFAQKQYLSAMSSLETARVRAESQSRYLMDFVAPSLPDESVWPMRGKNIALTFVFATLIFSIGSLIIAAIREHVGK